MASNESNCVRFPDDPEMAESTSAKGFCKLRLANKFLKKAGLELHSEKLEKNGTGNNFHEKQLSRVFSEDYDAVEKMILDPRGPVINKWNKIFLVACLVSLFVDPLFFYLPHTKEGMCIEVSTPLEISLTIIRLIVDAFYFVQIYIRFRTAYVAPSSRVFGRGELIIDSSKISSKYISKDFWLDVVAAQPLPQLLVWAVIPHLKGASTVNTKNVIRLVIICQYLLRLYLIFPLSSQIIKASGLLLETAWAGAAYNLMLFMLASHVLGACWYLLSIERQEECWRKVCSSQHLHCYLGFFDCHLMDNPTRVDWFMSSNITSLCDPEGNFFQFGIFADALRFNVTAASFFNKYFYCLWWGLRNLSSLGQNLFTSTYAWESVFAIIIAIIGLVLFGLLIGNMQTYLQSTTVRLEEWRIRRMDTEEWMRHRQLPHELKQCVRKYDQYRWVATRGVDEEAILKGLPMDLRRDIKRHLCLDLVRQVPLFDLMDDRMLDAICERLKPHLCTPGTSLVQEGDPVNEMLFIVRGHLDSYTTDGGRSGFFNSCHIGPGDFCGEELLTWALDPHPGVVLPSSTRTVKAITEVEAFAFIAGDLKFVASQYRKLHSKQLRHMLRCHSPQWRTWAACFIQAAWFRHKRRKEAGELKKKESTTFLSELTEQTAAELQKKEGTTFMSELTEQTARSSALASAFLRHAGKLAMSSRRVGSQRSGIESEFFTSLQKPNDHDFTVEYRRKQPN